MLVSVIIPTFNNLKVLKKSLPAILNQNTNNQFEYEVILINDGSLDKTEKWLQTLEEKNLRSISFIQNKGRSVARNTGFLHAKGDIIVFLDSDVIASPMLLLEHVRSIGYKKGSPPPKRVSSGRLINTYNLQDPFNEKYKIRDFSAAHFATGNTAIHRYFLEQVQEDKNGPFDQINFSIYGWEDLELGVRLSKFKLQYIRSKKALGYHFCPAFTIHSIPARIEKEIHRAHTANRFLKKHPTLNVRLMVQKTPFHRVLWELSSLGGILNEKSLRPILQSLEKKGHHHIAECIARNTFLNLYHIRHLFKVSHD